MVGKVITSALELEYRYAEPYIATRRDNEDLSEPLGRAASAILQEQAALPRSSRIELIENRAVQDRVLAAHLPRRGRRPRCVPAQDELSPQKEATAPGGTWSTYYTEKEAIEEKHLPTLLNCSRSPILPSCIGMRSLPCFSRLRKTSCRCPSWPSSPICSTTISSTG